MMKHNKPTGLNIWTFLLFMVSVAVVSACSDDDEIIEVNTDGPTVTQVYALDDDTGEWEEASESRLVRMGETIRIEGEALGEALAVYFNGTHSSTFEEVTDTYIKMVVPDEVELDTTAIDESVNVNVLRVVTMYGKYDYTLYYTGARITITKVDVEADEGWDYDVSSACIGEAIRIHGTGFPTDASDITVWFNGVQASTVSNLTSDRFTVTIPTSTPFGSLVDESTIRIKSPYYDYTHTEFAIEGRQGVVKQVVLNGGSSSITAASRGDSICIIGSYLATASEVYCNGVSLDFEVDGDEIILLIPEDLPIGSDEVDEDDLDIIRIVTAYDEDCTYEFHFRAFIPTVSSVSNKMPVAGGYFYLEGKNLYTEYINGIYMGDNELTCEEVGSDATVLKVYVPEDADLSSYCALTIYSDDLEIVVEPYMNYVSGLFLSTFSSDEKGLSGYSDLLATVYHTTESLPSSISSDLPCPEYILTLGDGSYFPVQSSEYNVAFYRFNPYSCIGNVISQNSEMTEASMEDLALEMEFYMADDWYSGFLAWRFEKNVGSPKVTDYRTYNIIPWTDDSPMSFEYGWRTYTIPFSSFTGLTDSYETLEDYYGYLYTVINNGSHALFGFFNYDVESDGRNYTSITSFQLNIANIRIVPLD